MSKGSTPLLGLPTYRAKEDKKNLMADFLDDIAGEKEDSGFNILDREFKAVYEKYSAVENTADKDKKVDTATKWATARQVTLTTDASGSVNIDGSANVNLPVTVNKATALRTARTIEVDLASATAESFDGSANIATGVKGILPVARGGLGNSEGNAESATKLKTARTIRTNLASTATASFDGTGNATPGVSGVLPKANGGTGNVDGKADSADKLATARTIRTNLAATTAASFDGTGNVTPGVTGVLPVANGGTGLSTIPNGQAVIGGGTSVPTGRAITSAATSGSDSLFTSGGAFNLLPPGAMTMYVATTAPSGWLLCNGQAVSRTTYANLYKVIGTKFGAGDGSTTFNLPNMKNRFPLGYDANLGEVGGQAEVSLLEAHNGRHNHPMTGKGVEFPDDMFGVQGSYYPERASISKGAATFGDNFLTFRPSGEGAPHNNMPPWLSIAYIIKF